MTILLVIIFLSLLILGHEAGHFFAARFFGMKADEFGFGFPPKIFGWRPKRKFKDDNGTFQQAQGETEYSVNWLPFGGFVRIAGENDRASGDLSNLESLPESEKKKYFLFQPAWRRSVVILAGVVVNFLIGWILISVIFMTGTPKALVITDIQKGSPAEAVGIFSGDIIKGYVESEPFINFVSENKGKEIEIMVNRGGEELVFGVTPRVEAPPDQGSLGVVLADAGFERLGFFAALGQGFMRTLDIVGLTFQTFYQLLIGIFTQGTLIAGVVGPVGIFGVAQKAGALGFIYLLQIVSLISINLAVLNLIPFPALDGGRFVLILAEKIKGSPIPLRAEAILNGVGFALLILLMVVVTIRDVTGWF